MTGRAPGMPVRRTLLSCCISRPDADLHVPDYHDGTGFSAKHPGYMPAHEPADKEQQQRSRKWWRQPTSGEVSAKKDPDQTKGPAQSIMQPAAAAAAVSIQQQLQQRSLDAKHLATASAVAAPGLLSGSCSAPLTSRSLSAAAIGCHSLSAAASVHGYHTSRPAGAIRHQDTGDSPSEIHSELQQPKVLSSYGTSCQRSGETAGSSRSMSAASDGSNTCTEAALQKQPLQQLKRQQQEQLRQRQQQQQEGLQDSSKAHSVPGSLSSALLLEPHQPLSGSNSCQATTSSAGSSSSGGSSSREEANAAAAAAAGQDGSERARGVMEPAGPAEELPGSSDCPSPTTPTSPSPFIKHPHLSPKLTDQSAASSSSTAAVLPPHFDTLQKLNSGASFRMMLSDTAEEPPPQEPLSPAVSAGLFAGSSGSSSSALAAATFSGGSGGISSGGSFGPTVDGGNSSSSSCGMQLFSFPSPPQASRMAAVVSTAAPAAAAAAVRPKVHSLAAAAASDAASITSASSFCTAVTRSKPAVSPFAQPTLQQSVATSLLNNRPAAAQQQQQQQQQGVRLVRHATAPDPPSFTSTPGGTAAGYNASTAAAGISINATGRMSSSSGPAALAGSTAAAAALQGYIPVTPRVSRVSWATSSVTLGAEPRVFDVLDPETSSTCSGHRILKQSASASSLTSLAGAGSSSGSSSAKEKLQQLRMAVSLGSFNAGFGNRDSGNSAAAAAAPHAAAAAGDAAALRNSTGSMSFKSILRRSTNLGTISTTSTGTGKGFRRSKSAHTNIMANQQQQLAREYAAAADQAAAAAAALASSSRCLPPLPPAAAAAAAAAHAGSTSNNSAHAASALATSGSSSSNSRIIATEHSRSPGSSSGLDGLASFSPTASSGLLVALAVNRMHSAHSAPNLSSAATSSSNSSAAGQQVANFSSSTASSVSSSSSSMGIKHSSSNSGLSSVGSGSSSSTAAAAAGDAAAAAGGVASSSQVATAFAEAFLAALAAGNTKWGSDAVVSQLLHDADAKMVGMDKQLYVGKTAIIRRLNSGMEQLVKMVQAYLADSSSGSGAGQAAAAAAAAASDLAGQMPKPLLSVSSPDPKKKPAHVVAVYTFKWGLRKFTLKDEFIVKNGKIVRLRRSRG